MLDVLEGSDLYRLWESRVHKGAVLLDEQFPSWTSQINQRYLSMSSQSNCILGQLYGSYARAILELCAADDFDDDEWYFAPHHGFEVDEETGDLRTFDEDQELYAFLRVLWLKEIAARV